MDLPAARTPPAATSPPPDRDHWLFAASETNDQIALIKYGPGGIKVERNNTTGIMPKWVQPAANGKVDFIACNESSDIVEGDVARIDLRSLARVATSDIGQQAGGIDCWKTTPPR